MTMTSPDRDRSHSADHHQIQQKQSGDQHILAEDEAGSDPHRPSRISREDMEKLRPADADPDDPAQP